MSNKNSKLNGLRKSILVAGSIVLPVLAQAQSEGNTLLSSTQTQLDGLRTNLINLIRTAMILAGIVLLVMVIVKVVKGDREAAEKLAWWIGGLAIGFTLLSVMKSI